MACHLGSQVVRILRKEMCLVRLQKRMLETAATSSTKVPRRALLYVPGSDMRKIQKAKSLKADCICLDMEDGVSATAKVKARETITEVLNTNTDFGLSEVAVRVNSISSGLAEQDMAAMFGECRSAPGTIVVPKVDNVDEARWLIDRLQLYPQAVGLQLITQMESAEGLLNLREVCHTLSTDLVHIRGELAAVIFGSDDFCASIGAMRSASGSELMYARQKLVAVCKAYKAQAIDMVHIDFKDLEAFRKYSLEGAAMGFTGKQVIHPNQVQPAHECFAPSPSTIRWAQELIQAFHKHKTEGKGAFTFNDQMIDMPSVLQAENIKNMADMIRDRES